MLSKSTTSIVQQKLCFHNHNDAVNLPGLNIHSWMKARFIVCIDTYSCKPGDVSQQTPLSSTRQQLLHPAVFDPKQIMQRKTSKPLRDNCYFWFNPPVLATSHVFKQPPYLPENLFRHHQIHFQPAPGVSCSQRHRSPTSQTFQSAWNACANS
jgi:hypothetical protein